MHASENAAMNTPAPLPAVAEFLAPPRQMLIGGKWMPAASGELIETPDPATGRALGTFPAGAEKDVDAAVVAARLAFQGPWRKVTPYERGRLLQKAAGAHRKVHRRIRAAHHPRQWQTALGSAQGSRDRGKLDGVLRRLDDKAHSAKRSRFRSRAAFSITLCVSRSASWQVSRRRIIHSRCRSTRWRPRSRPDAWSSSNPRNKLRSSRCALEKYFRKRDFPMAW